MPNINDYGLPFTSQGGDRKYSALEWREYFSRLIHNGLIQNAANECQVKPQAAPNKTVYVDTGVVFINGAMRVLEEPVTLAVAENTSGNPRIDRVVARLNEASRTIEFDVLEGTPAGSPLAPALTRTDGVYELGLADITLANGYSTITSGIIADQRWNVMLCGASSMTIGVIPPSGMEAETVTLSEETTGLYEVGTVDAALKKLKNIPKESLPIVLFNAGVAHPQWAKDFYVNKETKVSAITGATIYLETLTAQYNGGIKQAVMAMPIVLDKIPLGSKLVIEGVTTTASSQYQYPITRIFLSPTPSDGFMSSADGHTMNNHIVGLIDIPVGTSGVVNKTYQLLLDPVRNVCDPTIPLYLSLYSHGQRTSGGNVRLTVGKISIAAV